MARSCARSKSRGFMRQGDYWIIRYQGQAAILKATHGLDCLSYLLRHPGRDVHVSGLLATPIDLPVPASLGSLRATGNDIITAKRQDAGPILDSQGKAVYKRRIHGLRNAPPVSHRVSDAHFRVHDRSVRSLLAAGHLAIERRQSELDQPRNGAE
jgi:hypothetical protein